MKHLIKNTIRFSVLILIAITTIGLSGYLIGYRIQNPQSIHPADGGCFVILIGLFVIAVVCIWDEISNPDED